MLVGKHLVHQTVLDVDASGVTAGKVSDEFLEPRWGRARVIGNDIEQSLDLGSEAGGGQLPRILLCLSRVHEPPATHQSSTSEPDSMPSARAARIESVIPGMDAR